MNGTNTTAQTCFNGDNERGPALLETVRDLFACRMVRHDGLVIYCQDGYPLTYPDGKLIVLDRRQALSVERQLEELGSACPDGYLIVSWQRVESGSSIDLVIQSTGGNRPHGSVRGTRLGHMLEALASVA